MLFSIFIIYVGITHFFRNLTILYSLPYATGADPITDTIMPYGHYV